MSTRLQIAIEAVNNAKAELDSLKQQLGALPAEGKKASLSITDLKSALDIAAGAARMFGQAAKQAFDFTRAGAQVAQLDESFSRLGGRIDKLRQAAGGTIDDWTLMGSTLTLVAGASKETQAAMLDAAPRLIEIARAAAKLNPTLGDTVYFYDSLGRGIRRASPLILDNLGLTIRIEQAYEKYAQSIGTTTDKLSDTQRQLAILNAVLEQGGRMIEQAGGSVNGAADAWTRLEVSAKNVSDEVKRSTAEAIGPAVERFADWVEALRGTSHGFFKVNRGLDMFRAILGGSSRIMDEYQDQQRGMNAQTERMAELAALYAQQQGNANDEAAAAAAALQAAQEAAANAAIAFNDAAAGLDEMSIAQFVNAQLAALKKELDAGTISAEQYAAAQEAVLMKFGILTESEQSAQGALESLRNSFLSGKLSAEAYAAAIQSIKNNIDQIQSKTVTLDIQYNITQPPTLPPGARPVGFASGGSFIATRPTQILVGEGSRPEQVIVRPLTTNNFNVSFHNSPNPVQNLNALRALWGV